MPAIQHRYDFVYIFDVSNGNPNGDPDAGNLPRLDPETNQGLVTDVCLKRKVRNYVSLLSAGKEGLNIYVEESSVLNEHHRKAYRAVRGDTKEVSSARKLSPQTDEEGKALTRWMCGNFYDIRTFGAVMGTGINCGQVRGPIQLGFARSVEPIMPIEISITRMAATNEAEKKTKTEGADDRTENRTMGRKHIVPYGLYRVHGFINAKLAQQTGFGDEDISLFWEALKSMFEHDRSAARGEMSARKLVAFRHDSALGNAHAHELFERVSINRVVDGEEIPVGDKRLHNAPPARAFKDYRVNVNSSDLPGGVEILNII
jgi:CRISPR-associated protein Csd2